MKKLLSVFLALLFVCMIGSSGIDSIFASSDEDIYEEMPLYEDENMQDDQEDQGVADDEEELEENYDDTIDDQSAVEPSEEL